MTEYEALRNDLDGLAKGLAHYSDTAIRHLLEQSTQIDRLWADNAELRDELHAVANRLENLTRAVAIRPGSDFTRRGDDFSVADEAAAIVNDANRSTLREVREEET